MPAKKKLTFCAHHPDVAATGTCFECGTPICYNCTLTLFGHTFCSHRCASAYMGANLAKGIAILVGGVFRGLGRLLGGLGKAAPRSGVSLVLAAGLLASLFFIWRLDGQLRSLRQAAPSTAPAMPGMTDAEVKPPRIVTPAGGTVTSNAITVAGEAEANRIVSLSVNGTLREVVLPEKGQFRFENILLRRGENRLEVRALNPEGEVSTLETLTITYADPAVSFLARDFRRGPLDRAEMALTFDGGAEDNAAATILDALKAQGVHATFFLTGEFIQRYPETVRRIVNEGHEAGNHTWNHPHLTSYAQDRRHNTLPSMTQARLSDELKRTADLFRQVTGKAMQKLWRAPYGETNDEILRWAAKEGYRHIGWTVGRGWENNGDTMDWVADTTSTIYHSADEIVQKVVGFGASSAGGANGAVILMHLGTNRQGEFVHERLGEIIDGLEGRSIRLVTVSELMR